MKKILFPLLVLVMVLGLVVIPATPVDSAPADDDPRVCLTGISPATWVWLSGHAATSTAGLFHLTVDTVPYDGWCVDPDQQILVDNCFDAYLVNAPRQATPIDWCAIAYIMTNYSTFPDPLSPNREAAATQLAIWKYIKGGKTQILAYPAAVNERANDIYDLAAARAVNLFGPGLGLMNLWEGAGGSNSQVFNTAVTGSGCLDKIEVTFTTSAGSFSPTDPAITETTVLTDASGDVSATLYWDTSPFSASLTASTDGEWPVILEPEDPNIQSTAILKPFGLSVEKQFEPEIGPGLEVSKEADTEISKEGDEITYTITVNNTGDVDLDKMSVVDDLLPGVDAAFAATLVVGASETHDFVYTVKAGDPDPLVNEVTATYEDQTGTAVSDVATDTVDLVHPDLEVTKTAAPVSGEVGDTITYTIKVENKGDVELILDSVDDSLLGDLESSFASSLAALASESHDFTRDIAAGDPNPLVNTVTFHYHIEGLPNDITDKDDASVEVIHKCHASIEGYKFFNNCCINGEWDDNEAGIAGWWIGLFPYEYPYPGSINPDPTTWGDIPKVQTVTDDPSTLDINELGMFTFENVCAGAYYVVEEKRDGWISCTTWFENTWWGLTLKNYPLRDHYVVVVTNDNADNGDTIKVDVYGDGLLFGNKD